MCLYLLTHKPGIKVQLSDSSQRSTSKKRQSSFPHLPERHRWSPATKMQYIAGLFMTLCDAGLKQGHATNKPAPVFVRIDQPFVTEPAAAVVAKA